MENNEPKTIIEINNYSYENEINKLEAEIIPNTELDNLQIDHTFKIVVLGNAGVGKSCLSLKGTKGIFEDSYKPTIAFDFFSFSAKIENKIIRLQIWDTCGQEEHRSLIQHLFHGAGLAIIVYAINDIKSFNAISAWIKQLKNNSNPDVKLFLVGNKNDLKEERKISFEEGKKYSKDFEFFLFCETSAKTGINCQEIFLCAAKLLYLNFKNYNSGEIGKQAGKLTGNKKLGKNLVEKERKQKKGCC